MLNKFQRPARKSGNTDFFAVCDLPGFVELAKSASGYSGKNCKASDKWYGNKDYAVSLEQVRSGDLSGVAASEALLDKLETETFVTPMWRNTLDVAGGSPCVPAYLAGQPLNMRRRQRVLEEKGPLAVVVSMSLSAGIKIEDMRQRGATLLALVRMLSASRPVELWVAICLGTSQKGAHVLVRLDTAPLDLARAAHMLTCPSVTRGLGYSSCEALVDHCMSGWPHGDYEQYQKHARELYTNAAGIGSEVLYVGAAHVKDKLVSKPLEWLKETLSQYGGAPTE